MSVAPDTLDINVVQAASGPLPKAGSKVTVHYTGKFTDGKVFDSSVTRNKPFVFTLGAGQVIKGWDEGVAKMNVGSKVILTLGYNNAYGERGFPPVIPAKSTLVFEVELLSFE